METPEVKQLQKDVFEKLKNNREILERLQWLAVSNDRNKEFSKIVPLKEIEGRNGATIANISSSLSKALQSEIQSTSFEDEIVDNELQIFLNLLADLKNELKQKEVLEQTTKDDLDNAQKRLAELKQQKTEIEKIITARETGGEMVELRGYSQEEITKMEQKVKASFGVHKQELKMLLKTLYKKDHDQMLELLTELTAVAFSESGETYFDLDERPELQAAATVLLISKTIKRHPHYNNKLCLCVFD